MTGEIAAAGAAGPGRDRRTASQYSCLPGWISFLAGKVPAQDTAARASGAHWHPRMTFWPERTAALARQPDD